ncbi:integrator complex subunit 1-like [Actinia tenebrosa]|uniref:Integrator complex subunit 1-like n=1 Tax=Actinia tenebrosa TaxID=6105 RepID=A0A6P8J024_ACTTE|nr:integrator complex subunit 1-like [Actinia tenebrosa]
MSKLPPSRRPKAGARGHLPTGDLIALGPKSSRAADSDLKPNIQPPKPPQPPPPKKLNIPGSIDKKRDSSSPLTPAGTPKRIKLIGSPPYSPHVPKAGDGESCRRPSTSGTQYFPTQISPIEVNSSELEKQLLEAELNGDKTRIDGLLLGAIKGLKSNRAKPDPASYLTLLYLAKYKPEYFDSSRILEALTSLLKRDISVNLKANKTLASIIPIMAANILLYVYQDIEDWSESFVKVYVEDSLGDRVWVDTDACQSFVNNILTAFGTKKNPKTFTRQGSDPGTKTTGQAEPVPPTTVSATYTTIMMPSTSREDDEVVEEMDLSSNLEEDVIPVFPRFTLSSVANNISTYVLELVQEQLTRRQPVENISRNLLRLLTSTSGYNKVRLLVSQKIEMWLLNPKLTRPAQELLMSLSINCNTHSRDDVDVISNLIRMRLKTKPLANHYVSCIRELVNQHPENLGTVLKYVIYNELSTTRNPNNMALLGMMFQYKPEAVSKILAMVFQDLLMNKDDYLRACRALLKEIVRVLRHEMNFVALCRGFMQERTDTQFKELDPAVKERMFLSLADLITMTTMLSISPVVKDLAMAFARGDKKNLTALHEFQKNVSVIQRDAVWWLHTVVPKMFNPNGKDFLNCLQKVLYLEPLESYCAKDNFPTEADRNLFYNLVSDVPVQEDTLMRIIIIGLGSELPLNAPEALDIADRIVRRAATIKTGVTPLKVTRLELLDAMLNLCAYHHPKDIQLPTGYVHPKLAISNLYWKAWGLSTIVSSLNPDSIGKSGWDNFPMLRSLMEMIMTNNCTFPPPTIAASNDEKEQIIAQDMQLVQIEKEEILQFESHLAAATTGVAITEQNSLLLSQLISMDPVGPARRPPQSFLDELKKTNKALKLGQKLCRNRSPDFLLDIIQRQGTSQSMPWLAELVQSSEGSLDVLPVQCLCEFLLMEQPAADNLDQPVSTKEGQEKKMNNQKHVLSRLRWLLTGPSADADSTVEVIEYFMRRLSSSITKERNAAAKGLELVLSQSTASKEDEVSLVSFSDDVSMLAMFEEMSFPESTSASTLKSSLKWLLVNLPRLPHFETVRPICCFALRQCCQVEIVLQRLQAYLVFLSEHTGSPADSDFADALLEISQLVIERPTIFHQMLGDSPAAEETFQALLRMYERAVQHAIEAQESSFFEVNDPSTYNGLLDTWCPENGHVKVFLTDTGEEAVLLPEWLRLRMIRAGTQRVVDTAISDLIPSQLVLFAQSFGIPVYSMSKLLQQLDVAAQHDALSLDEAVLDKGTVTRVYHSMLTCSGPELKLFQKLETILGLNVGAADIEDNEDTKQLENEMKGQLTAEVIQANKGEIPECTLSDNLMKSLLKFVSQNALKRHSKATSSFTELIQKLSSRCSKAGPLSCMLQQYKKQLGITETDVKKSVTNILKEIAQNEGSVDETQIRKLIEAARIPGTRAERIDKDIAVKACMKVKSSNPQLLDDVCKALFSLMIFQKTRHEHADSPWNSKQSLPLKTCVEILTTLLSCDPHGEDRSAYDLSKGLFVDWLETVDPEIVNVHPLVQRQLLFSDRPQMSNEEGSLTCTEKRSANAYLLASLAHNSNYSCLQDCLDWLLAQHEQSNRINPGAALDFVWTCFHIPRLWQGREQKSTAVGTNTSETAEYEDPVLSVTPTQACHVTRLVLAEADAVIRNLCRKKGVAFEDFDKYNSQSNQDGSAVMASLNLEANELIADVIRHRMPLLLLCCHGNDSHLKATVDYLIKTTRWPSWLKSQCLAHIYLAHPRVVVWLQDHKSLFTSGVFTKATHCQLDALCHRVLTILADCKPGREYEESANSSSLLCRSIAATHPMLLLRHLPMIACLLRGRVHLTSKEFSNQQHLLLFSHVLGILDLVRPHVFIEDKCIEDGLEETLFVYFELVQSPCLGFKEVASVLSKFTEFLYHYCTNKPEKSLALLQSKSALLNDLLYDFPDLPSLKCLVSALSVPKASAPMSSTAVSLPAGSSKFRTMIMPLEISTWTPAQLAPAVQQLSPWKPSQDILKALVDLDETSKRRVDILQHFTTELVRLMANNECNLRTKAHTLIQRHLRQHPRDANKFIDSYMECLGSSNPDVSSTAAKFLPEFILLCSEYSSQLLQKLFCIAVFDRNDVVGSLTRSIQLMNLEFKC